MVVSWGVAEDIGDGRGIRPIIAAQGQDLIGHRLSYADARFFVTSLGDWCQRLLKFGIKCALECRIQGHENFVSRCGRCRLL